MKKTLAVFLLTALVLSLSGCAMRQEIIDWIVSISAEESIPGMESGAVIETVLGDRLPIAAGEVDLKEGEVEEKNGYLLYRFYALTTADATAYASALDNLSGLSRVGSLPAPLKGDLPSYYMVWEDGAGQQVRICLYGEEMVLMVGQTLYLPPHGNAFIYAGMPVQLLGDLPYDPDEDRVYDPENASSIVQDGVELHRASNVPFASVINYVYRLCTREGYQNEPGYGVADYPTDQAKQQIGERLIKNGHRLYVVFYRGDLLILETDAEEAVSEEVLWSYLGKNYPVKPGVQGIAERMERFGFTEGVKLGTSFVECSRKKCLPADSEAMIASLKENGFVAVSDQTDAEGVRRCLMQMTDRYGVYPYLLYAQVTYTATGDLSLRMATDTQSLRAEG